MPTNNKKNRRQFLKTTGGIAAAATVAGCTGDDPATEETGTTESGDGSDETESDTDETEPGSEGEVTFRLTTQTMDNFDPIASTSADASVIITQVYDNLIDTINSEVPPEPLLATEYEISNDGRTYTFSLKEGVQFHNGDEMTADDVVYSLERLAASPNTRRAGYFLDSMGVAHETNDEGGYVSGSAEIEAVDDYTFEMTLSRPYAWATEILGYKALSVIPEGIVGDIEGYDGEMDQNTFATENPIGSGPFEFDYWESGTDVSVTKFEEYHGDTANVDRVHWQIMTDLNAQYNYSMNRNSDIISLPTSQYNPENVTIEEEDDRGRRIGTYGPLRNGDTANYLIVPDLSTYFIGFNTERVEKAARQATAYVITQAGINQNVYKDLYIPSFHVTPNAIYPGGVDAYDSHAEENYPYGYNEALVDEARQVMEDAGYSQNDRYSYSVYTTGSSTHNQLLGRIRDKLASAHVDLEITESPFSTWWAEQKDGNFDAMLFSWGMGWSDPANILALCYPPNADASADDTMVGSNWSGTEASQQAREAYETYQENANATDEAAETRAEMVNTIEEAVWEDVPMTTLVHFTARRLSYDWVDIPRFGTVGGQMFNNVEIDTDAQPSG
jgi:peptide/nickel transport system substrate-binding protein